MFRASSLHLKSSSKGLFIQATLVPPITCAGPQHAAALEGCDWQRSPAGGQRSGFWRCLAREPRRAPRRHLLRCEPGCFTGAAPPSTAPSLAAAASCTAAVNPRQRVCSIALGIHQLLRRQRVLLHANSERCCHAARRAAACRVMDPNPGGLMPPGSAAVHENLFSSSPACHAVCSKLRLAPH